MVAQRTKVKKEQQVRMIGNSVVPAMARALVEANVRGALAERGVA